MDASRHQEITLYIYEEGGKETCRFLPAKTGQAVRTINKGLPFGFYLLEMEDDKKLLYSDDAIIPIERGWSPDLVMRGGEPCIIDGEGIPHFFVKTFPEFREELIEAESRRYPQFRFYYKEPMGPDGKRYPTDILVAEPLYSGKKREICNADDLYDVYQYGIGWDDLLCIMEEENKTSFIAPMQHLADPKCLWDAYKDQIIPELSNGWGDQDLITMQKDNYHIKFVVQNKADVTGNSDFFLTREQAEKMNVDARTLYQQSVRNLEGIVKEDELVPPYEIEAWLDKIDDYPGAKETSSYASLFETKSYYRSVILLPKAQEELEKSYPDGYRIGVTHDGNCIAYPRHIVMDGNPELTKLYAMIDSFSQEKNGEEESEAEKEAEPGHPKKGLFEGLFHKKKAKAAAI